MLIEKVVEQIKAIKKIFHWKIFIEPTFDFLMNKTTPE